MELNWSNAEVKEGKLTVGLEGDVTREWRASFETTVQLLGGHGDWGEVALKKGRVHVGEVSEGDEERLRHFLESAVLQANTAAGQDEDAEESEEADDSGDRKDDERDSPDSRMAERFRSFGS